MAVDRVIPVFNVGECDWPEMAPYGSLTFHLHIRQLVTLWNSFPTMPSPTAFVDVAAEKMGYTVIHFDSVDEFNRFNGHHMLHGAILTQHFDTDAATGTGLGNGYVQFRNSYPKEFIDSFLRTIAQGNHDLQIAVNRASTMMQASRSAMLSMTNELDSERQG
jgi:hypothetical protein